MTQMFSPDRVHRDPKDIALVIQVSLQQISGWLLYQFEGLGLPDHLMQHIRDLDLLKQGLAPLYDEMLDGDSLWLCRSRSIGPLYGNEGIALVRNRRPIIYLRVLDY